eukprot:TRINITY_DN1097_c0_g1_i1.p1 TRINITY_DN1097_c0_g1~~TRINITY_DN1097_c0_g1_i1.p1  ORF type:complete len:192 (-),score=71.06 TRINITY_DN1097_c0_g1_i1:341-916(-)
MASRGAQETQKLQENVKEQLNRLLTQLKDLEEEKEELGDEYEPMKKDTMEQLKEFNASLNKMMQGNMTLVDAFGGVQLAIQAAISEAFKTPEVLQMFAKKDNNSLRQHLTQLQTASKLGKVSKESYTNQAVEILTALSKLGEPLSDEEQAFLQANKTKALSEFETVTSNMGANAKSNILNSAANANKKAQN